MTADGKERVENLGLALSELGRHAADMVSQGQDHHDACLWCETMILLARTMNFGEQLRRVELSMIPPDPTVIHARTPAMFCGRTATHPSHGIFQDGVKYICTGVRP